MKTIQTIVALVFLSVLTLFEANAQGRLTTGKVFSAMRYIPKQGNVWQTLDMGNTWFQLSSEISAQIRNISTQQSQATVQTESVSIKSELMSIEPNPIESNSGSFTIRYNCNQIGAYTVYDIGVSGSKTILWEGTLQTGAQTIEVAHKGLSAGVHFISIENGITGNSVSLVILR